MTLKQLFVILGLTGFASMGYAIEEPAYEIAQQIDNVELRDYVPSIQARTAMASDDSSSSSFRRLANYIFGGNAQEQSIAMTAPVETHMTDTGYMAFTLPSQYTMAQLPSPSDQSVSLHAVPARRIAVIAFSGWATDGRVEEKSRELLSVLEANAIQTIGEPFLNQYNPPWTLPWNRRNEVAVLVSP